MIRKEMTATTLAAGAMALVADEAEAKTDAAAVNKALETLKTYDWGDDRKTLDPIDQAIIATQDDTAARKALEKSLVDALSSGISRSAQDFVCRKLRVIGTRQSIDALAALLPDEDTSSIARYALGRMAGRRATTALRNALTKVGSKLKPGIVGSLGIRRDKRSTEAISKLLADSNIDVARAAAHSLGLIGTSDSAKALSQFAKTAPPPMKMPVADACLLCAEQLLADGDKAGAVAMYKGLSGKTQPKHVKVAAMKGMLTAASKT